MEKRWQTGSPTRRFVSVLASLGALFVIAASPTPQPSKEAASAAKKAAASPTAQPPKAPAAQAKKAPAPKAIDWDRLTQEAADFLSKYIKLNTTNPPGHEIDAAGMLKEKFLAEGIPATVWEPEKGRGIIAARLRGIGNKKHKTLILLSHIDVAPANPTGWQVPPFSGEIKDGSVWGRGAVDDKGPGVIAMMAMLAVKRSGVLLHRDVLFVATGDEEEGGKEGAEWFTDNEKDIFSDAGYLLNEGGGIAQFPDGKLLYEVSVAEKTALWIRLNTTGSAVYSSAPPANTAVTHLVGALSRLADYRPPIKVSPLVADDFRLRAQLGHGPAEWLDLASSFHDPLFAHNFVEVPRQNAQVRDTVALTVISAGSQSDEIAPTAYADVDCRLLPGEDPTRFLATVRKLIDDDSIKIQVLLDFPSTSSPPTSTLMTAIEALAQRMDKTSAVPVMIPDFTDSRHFRGKNITAYGFVPLQLAPAEAHSVRGVDERIGIKEMGEAIRRMVELLEIFGGKAQQ